MVRTSGTNKREIVHRSIADLVPYARNSRTHSDEQIAQIAASIREFGWTNPLLIDEAGGIVAGHGRLLAAQSLGAKDVPCIVLEGLSEAQKHRCDWSEAWALFPGDVAYVWHAGNMAHTVAESLVSNGLNIRAQIIWNKSNMVISRGDYHPKHEPCWYAVRKGKPGHYVGGRKQTTVWDIDKPQKSETGHSTQKPVECMKRPIENNSSPGQAVYEPFSGSGTTIIAGEMTGRSIHAIELSEQYVDVAVLRWQEFTGGEATLEATGEPFTVVREQRAKVAEAA